MKFLQTFWTGPAGALKADALSIKAGWLSSEYHWMSWALSCLQAKRVFGEVNLVTDLKGKEILIDKLQLPYANVSTELECSLDQYHPALFALAKIFSYGLQTEPFLHLDSDVFIWHKPDDSWLNSRLLAQNKDKNLPFYKHALNEINQHFKNIPSFFLKEHYEHKDIYASNAGLLGGNDIGFFKTYSMQAFAFIDNNKKYLNKLNVGNLNFIFEQYLFYLLAAKANIPISYLKEPVDHPLFKDYIKFEDLPNVQMIHPVGGFKKQPHVCDHVAKKLRRDYPEYYYRIIDTIVKTNQSIRSAVYYELVKDENLSSLSAIPTIVTSFFERTQAAINYLNNKHSFNLKVDNFSTQSSFADNLAGILPKGRERECLFEIFCLELARNSLINKLYTSVASISQLYQDDLIAYHKIQDIFLLPDDDLGKVKLKTADNFEFMELGWDWKYDNKVEIDALISRNFNQDRSEYTVLLLSRILQMNIREYYIDELDTIIFRMLQKVCSIRIVLQQMKKYFSQEEIANDYLSFKLLIIKTIKQLLYAGAVKIYL
jgi:hypothetical protein